MAYIRTVGDDEATGSLKKQYDAAIERAGKVWEIVRIHSLDPAALRASMQIYHATTISRDVPLGRREREMIAVVVSRANDCFY